MKLLFSALLVAASTASFAQVQSAPAAVPGLAGGITSLDLQSPLPPGPESQAGCPVVLTEAHLNWPATLMPVTAAEGVTEPNLALGFENASGKGVRSVTIKARFLGKTNVYQLDARAFDLRLTFANVATANIAFEQLEEIQLPAKMHLYGVTRVSLDQVRFADGDVWTAIGHENCALNVSGAAERIAR